jgi:SAM-dependent methyltransferase
VLAYRAMFMDADEYRRMAAAGDAHWWYVATRQLLTDMMEPHLLPVGPNSRYLDAAGGTGATGRWLAERAATAVVDVDEQSIAIAAAQTAGYRAVLGDLNALPHPNQSFDAVLCVTALCHRMNTDPAATVRELARVTRPGGLVCLMEPGVRRLRRGHDRVTHTARRFSRRDLGGLLRGAGLDVIRETGAYSFLVPPAAVLAVLERGRETSDVGRNESGLGGAFALLARTERAVLRRTNLPAGLSAIAIGSAV